MESWQGSTWEAGGAKPTDYTPTWQEMAKLNSSWDGSGAGGYNDPNYQNLLKKVGSQDRLNKFINQYSYSPEQFAGFKAANPNWGYSYGGSWKDLMGAGGQGWESANTPQATTNQNGSAGGSMPYDPNQTIQGQGGTMGMDQFTTGGRPPSMPTGGGFNAADWFDPGYNFRLKEGSDLAQGSAAARGGLMSGATLKALTRYGQDMASQEYGNAWNRFAQNRGLDLQSRSLDEQAAARAAANALAQQSLDFQRNNSDRDFAYRAAIGDRDFNYGSLRDLVNWGLQGSQGEATDNRLLAALLSQNALSGGQVDASGTMGGANTISNLISQIVNQGNESSLMRRFFPNGYNGN